MAKIRPVHPGEILREEFMQPLNLTMNKLALDLHVPATRISDIVHGRRGITPATALRLSRYFNTTPEFWMNLQTNYELRIARVHELRRIERDVHPIQVAAAARA